VVAVVAAVLALGLIGVLAAAHQRWPDGAGDAWRRLGEMFRVSRASR
jgi:hypothetical protein